MSTSRTFRIERSPAASSRGDSDRVAADDVGGRLRNYLATGSSTTTRIAARRGYVAGVAAHEILIWSDYI
jgi:hypothetical protein